MTHQITCLPSLYILWHPAEKSANPSIDSPPCMIRLLITPWCHFCWLSLGCIPILSKWPLCSYKHTFTTGLYNSFLCLHAFFFLLDVLGVQVFLCLIHALFHCHLSEMPLVNNPRQHSTCNLSFIFYSCLIHSIIICTLICIYFSRTFPAWKIYSKDFVILTAISGIRHIQSSLGSHSMNE